MSDQPGPDALSPIKRALLEIRELRARVSELEGAAREPIAITGIALRFPGGATDLASFERMLWNSVDAISLIPKDRWDLDRLFDADPDAAGKMFTRHGGFLDGVDEFDAEFFNINPREAASMDPQQRLVLQVAWEALENAGQSPTALMGSRTGVYLGIANNDYGRALFAHPELIDVYFSPGNAHSVASGRLSYFLGAHGPAVSVDTACSSSLTAVHLASQALRNGECDLALAGGVNLILTPEMNINFSKARMLAPDGRCKTFDARADGYVRGEGVAFLVLERLSDARSRRRRIHALLRGSAINQDGRSNGLTAPNGPAQEAVIRSALDNAGVHAADVGYVEAHGTGTSLGDPIEVQALGAVFGADRPATQPLMIGSVKTNIGHLEAAAGVAGVVKAVLALKRAEVPPHLHFETPSPFIDWRTLNVSVPVKPTAWPSGARRRVAGVSSFGFSGTNAHVILEQAPEAEVDRSVGPDRPLHVLPISARDDASLRALVQRHFDALANCADIAAWCHAAGAERAHFSHRVSVVGGNAEQLRAGLAAFLSEKSHPAVVAGIASTKPKFAFLFTGQGPQHIGMARALYETLPVFRSTFDECAAAADPLLKTSLRVLLYENSDGDTPIEDARLAQPALFAVELALAAVWRSWGIEPAAVLGHSFGEYVAAAVAGVMSVEDAMRAVVARTSLVHEFAPTGRMAAIFASQDVVARRLADEKSKAVIATFNGPDHVVISGPLADVEEVCSRFEASGVRAKLLHVSYASHSPLMEPVLEPFRRALSSIHFSAPQVPIVSNLTGGFADRDTIGRIEYWCDHLRRPVQFADSMRTLHADGITHYIEIGPHPVLLGIGAACVPSSPDAWLPSLRRDADDWATIATSLQTVYAAGATIDWNAFDAPWPREHVTLPTYPFRAKRYWMDMLGVNSSAQLPTIDRWTRVTRAVDRAAMQGPLDLDVATYPRAWEALARVTSAHALRFLRRHGMFSAAGERRSLDEVMQAGGVGESYRHLMRRRLNALAADGVLRVVDGGWQSSAPLTEPAMDALWSEAERLLAGNPQLLAYVRNCGRLMDDVLAGRESPLETLFPGGSSELAIGLYEKSQTMRWVNGLAGAAFDAIGASVPPGQALRILEVGAGTGGTTGSVLSVLPADRTQYTFTDVSDFFFHDARSRLSAYPFVRFGRFDVDAELSEQGFAPRSFDVILSANAIHASKDLRAAVSRLRDLLSPGGLLVLVESTTHHAWFDMTTGLIEGWQHFADDLRGDNPLLDADTWTRVLREGGFADAVAWPERGSPAESLGLHLIVARAPGDATLVASAAPADTVSTRHAAATPAVASQSVDMSIRERIATAIPDERSELLRAVARDAVVRVLRLDPADAPSRNTRLMALGMDSLMAVQLRNVLGASIGLSRPLPATLMFDHPTIDALAAFLETRLELPAAASATVKTHAVMDAPAIDASAIAAMSDDDIERLLLERSEND